MQQRRIGDRQVSAIGLGGMPMSVEGRPDRARSIATVHAALEAGVTLIDTADAYHQGAEAVHDDCWSISPSWLLDHPDFYQQLKALDDRLTEMERKGASGLEYRAVLERLVQCVRHARALYEQECEQVNERAVQ